MALIALLIEKRKNAGLTQNDLATALNEYQTYVSRLESGQRRVDVVEFLTLARVMDFEPIEALREIMMVED